MNKTTNYIITFLLGVATGGILGLLYAPSKGKHLRAKLSYEFSKYGSQISDLVEEIVEGKEVAYSEAKTESEKVISQTRHRAEQLLSEVSDMVNKANK
ncbi:MAG: YtxH domain-containing protein [Microscillaceae bacterium]|nr:YtxH domain-containing protein [Microscillaceae bacterium]MDW8459937.1 YtxH domain-containing protein [Cytophagales bacterium]